MTNGVQGLGRAPTISCVCVRDTYTLCLRGWYELSTDREICVLNWESDCVWHGSCGWSRGVMERVQVLWPEANPFLCPDGCPFACLSHLCVCLFVHCLNIYLLILLLCRLGCICVCILPIILSCAQIPVDIQQQCWQRVVGVILIRGWCLWALALVSLLLIIIIINI